MKQHFKTSPPVVSCGLTQVLHPTRRPRSPAPTMAPTVSDFVAYSVPAFFLFAIGYVTLVEMIAEPYGWTVGTAKIDNGSRVISMLLPTLISGVLRLAGLLVLLAAVVAMFTKSGRAAAQRLFAGGSGGKRFD